MTKNRLFGSTWGKLKLPIKAKVGIIDKHEIPQIGLSAMQLDNIGHSGKYNGVVASFVDKKVQSRLYNAYGIHAMDADEVRISSALSSLLGCSVNDYIGIESVTVMQDSELTIMRTSILFLAADPTNASRLRLGEEFREIDEQLAMAKQRSLFSLKVPNLSLRPKDITRALLDAQPQIVHFSGHGTSTGALCFENETGQMHPIQPDALSALFELFADKINCVVLNACYSDIQAKAIAENINYVIGMNKEIEDKAAIAFSLGFYQGLGAGRTIEDAFRLGCVQIRLQGIPEHLTPVLIRKGQMQTKATF